MACPNVPIIHAACEAIVGVGKDVAGDVLGGIAHSFSTAAGDFLKMAMSLYLKVGLPDLQSKTGAVANLQSHVAWLTSVIAVVSILVCAGKMALTHDGRPAADVLRGLVTMILVTSVLVPATVLVSEAVDGFSTWIVDSSTRGNDFNSRVGSVTAGLGSMAPGGAIIVAFFIILTSLALVALAIVRGALIVALVGAFIPIASGAAATTGGQHALRRLLGILISWVAFKGVAAVILSASFWMVGTGTSGLDVISGVVLIGLSAVSIIPLTKLLSPVAMVGIGGGGGGMAGAAATGATTATRVISSGSSSSSAPSGPSPSAAPSGAVSAPTGAWSPSGAGAASNGSGAASAASNGGAAGGASAGAAAAGPAAGAVLAAVEGARLVKGTADGAVGKVGGNGNGSPNGSAS